MCQCSSFCMSLVGHCAQRRVGGHLSFCDGGERGVCHLATLQRAWLHSVPQVGYKCVRGTHVCSERGVCRVHVAARPRSPDRCRWHSARHSLLMWRLWRVSGMACSSTRAGAVRMWGAQGVELMPFRLARARTAFGFGRDANPTQTFKCQFDNILLGSSSTCDGVYPADRGPVHFKCTGCAKKRKSTRQRNIMS